VPFVHSVEQHWLPLVHVLPAPRHEPPLRLWQVPVPVEPHCPVQHDTLLVQVAPTLKHAEA
jgi:hypothetical protein